MFRQGVVAAAAGGGLGLMPSLTPALLLVLLAGVGAWDGPGPFGREDGATVGLLESYSLSNRLLATAADGSLSRHNGFPRERFEWTSPAGIPSSNRSYIPSGTNSLRR